MGVTVRELRMTNHCIKDGGTCLLWRMSLQFLQHALDQHVEPIVLGLPFTGLNSSFEAFRAVGGKLIPYCILFDLRLHFRGWIKAVKSRLSCLFKLRLFYALSHLLEFGELHAIAFR